MNDSTKRSYLRPEITPRWDQYLWAVRYADDDSFDFALFTTKIDADAFCQYAHEGSESKYEVVGVKR